MSGDNPDRPGAIARFRSRQSGHPTGLVGRIFGRAMVKDTAEANDQAIALLRLSEPSTVLEIGFGQGRTAAILLDAGHRVIGADPSETMVQQATSRVRRAGHEAAADLRHSDGVTIPFADDTADAAFTVHTIYFMPQPAATIAEAARVLRPGGTLVIACRTSDSPMPAWMDPLVYRVPSAAQVCSMLTTGGFLHLDHQTSGVDGHELHLFAARTPGVATA